MTSSNHDKDKFASHSLHPRVKRRQEFLLQRRREKLIQLWRLLVYTTISAGLGWLLLSKGWSPINTEQIQIQGNTKLNAKSVINASNLPFPQPLLAINPRKLEKSLLRELPIKAVAVRRRLIPPGLEVELLSRQPIAYASRRNSNGPEQGMVDIEGAWMPLRVANKADNPKRAIYVEGWMASHRKSISLILQKRDSLGSPVQRIILTPNGELIIQTQEFEMVQLGANSGRLDEQLKSLAQLSRSLPSTLRSQAGTKIDMRDPSKPELQMPRSTN